MTFPVPSLLWLLRDERVVAVVTSPFEPFIPQCEASSPFSAWVDRGALSLLCCDASVGVVKLELASKCLATRGIALVCRASCSTLYMLLVAVGKIHLRTTKLIVSGRAEHAEAKCACHCTSHFTMNLLTRSPTVYCPLTVGVCGRGRFCSSPHTAGVGRLNVVAAPLCRVSGSLSVSRAVSFPPSSSAFSLSRRLQVR